MASPQKENGYTSIANELVERLALLHLTPNEWRFLWALWRKTYSWHKKTEIDKQKFWMQLTGLSKVTISEVKKSLINKKVVTKNGNKIGFNKDWTVWKNKLPKTVTVTENGNSSYRKRYQQQVSKRNYIKETIYICAFDKFWSIYPRKVNKKKALQSWKKIKPDSLLLEKILSAVKKQSSSKQWLDSGGKYIPHPTTWLNGRRWEDEEYKTTEGIISI